MSTLIEVRNSDGVVGRCDAKCYDAQHDGCDCVCGGKNHGTGKQRAVDNTRELAKAWIKEYAERTGLTEFKGLIADEVAQRDLF